MAYKIKPHRRKEYKYIKRIRANTNKLPNDVIHKLRRDGVFISAFGSPTSIKAFRDAWDKTPNYIKEFLLMKFIEPELDLGVEYHRFTRRERSRTTSYDGLLPGQDIKACIKNGRLIIFNSVTLELIKLTSQTRKVLGKSVLRRNNINAARRLADSKDQKALKVAVWINEYDKFLTYASTMMNDISRRYNPLNARDIYVSGYQYMSDEEVEKEISILDDSGSPVARKYIRNLDLFIKNAEAFNDFTERLNLGDEHREITEKLLVVRDAIKDYHDFYVWALEEGEMQLEHINILSKELMEKLIQTANILDKIEVSDVDTTGIRFNAKAPVFRHRGLDTHLHKTSVKKLAAVKKRLKAVYDLE